MENCKKYLVEFIGTFFLILTIGCMSTIGSSSVITAIAIGFALMIMVYAGGHISGGHYNPAVSLAAAIRGALPYKQVLPYWIFQILGGIVAAYIVKYIAAVPVGISSPEFNIPALILGEFLFTFALCYVVLTTATDERTSGNSYYGLAIGSTVIVGACAVGGSICLGAFNPAVAISLTVISGCCAKLVGITALTNLVAGILAAMIFKFIK